MNLLIAEKPSVATGAYRELLEKMEGEKFTSGTNCLVGKNWTISWCVGHLVELAMPEDYGIQSWGIEVLPIVPGTWQYSVKDQTRNQFDTLVELMGKADKIVNGTDAGREGELIFRLVHKVGGFSQKPHYRLWVNSFVLEDMQKAWKQLREASDPKFRNLALAAMARQQADWLIGINASRGYIAATGERNLSVGRVQTPTLSLIVKRDKEVEGFQESFFYQLQALFKGVKLTYVDGEGEKDFETKEALAKLLSDVLGKEGLAEKVDKKRKSELPPFPFDLAGLQQKANEKLGFSAARTLELAQLLYEKKYITYPRTDSDYLPETMQQEAEQLLLLHASAEEKKVLRPSGDSFKFFNSAKVSDHYAIIPTSKLPEGLNSEEQGLFQLIRSRFVMAFGKPYVYDHTALGVRVEGHLFLGSFKAVVDLGFKALHKEENEGEEEQELKGLEIQQGEKSPIEGAEIVEKKRAKPKYYTDSTLLKAMLTCGRSVEDKELYDAMKEKGIGTPATRAAIIETLKSRNYIEYKGKSIVSTLKGRSLISLVDDRLANPTMTGEWEHKLQMIEKGGFDYLVFMKEIESFVRELVPLFSQPMQLQGAEASGDEIACPKCKKAMALFTAGAFCNSCEIKIFRKVAQKELTDKMLKDLLEKKKTGLIKGFKGKSGKAFDAKLILNEDYTVTFEFQPKKR